MAVVAVIVIGAVHFSEGGEFVRLAKSAQPWWLFVALLLQAATYLAQGQIWRSVGRAARFSLPVRTAFALSLAKLFFDQALPSGGISGTVVVARSLEERGMPRAAVMSAVVIATASHYGTYVLAIGAALLITVVHHRPTLSSQSSRPCSPPSPSW
jgi:Mg2+-importing ATPase